VDKSSWTVSKDMFLTKEEIQKLYAVLEDIKDLAIYRGRFYVYVRDYYIIRTLLETGLRVSELCSLKVEDFRGNSLIVQHGKAERNEQLSLQNKHSDYFKSYKLKKR